MSQINFIKKELLFIILSMIFIGLTISCQENDVTSEYPFEAKVINQNIDCGLYEIKITKGIKRVKSIVGQTLSENIYIAANLPIELKINNLDIKLGLRKPNKNEITACTTLGLSYNWVYVTKAIKK